MGLIDKIKNIGMSAAATLVEKTGAAVDAIITNKEEIMTLNNELSKIVNEHERAMEELRVKEIELELKDIDSARNMQIAALNQNDIFSKRFIYYLASGVIFLVFVFDFMLFAIKYPVENRDMINMVAGILNSTALVMILGFFYGSSQGSKEAGKRLDKILNK